MIRLGVCYYPEHWPEAVWAQDAAQMKALGLSTVRIGEFAWSRIEPSPGVLDWGWLDRAVETLHAAGLQVIMGTPTATPPKWLIDAHPDVLACDAYGRPRTFGSRRHYSFSSRTYRRESARIVDLMAARYGGHPAITIWQTDNEYGCHDTVESNDADAQAAFRLWLAEKYGSVDALNTAWGAVFWSQEYRSFDQVDPPLATVTEPNPAHVMDWRRFSSDQVAEYNAMQCEIIRRHAPQTDVTHNFMGHFTEFDHYKVGAQIDISTWDSYPLGFLEQVWWDDATKLTYARTGHPDFAGFHHDLYRGLSKGRFGVMEQQPGPVNWAGYNPAPEAGMVALWTLEAVAHGAELVSYFRWRQAPFAQEQMHAGLNRPDFVPDQASFEAEAALAVLKSLGEIAPAEQAKVALVYDYEAHWAHQIQPQGRSFRHDELSFVFYTALRRYGVDVDIIHPDTSGAGYDLVVVPSCPMLTQKQLAGLSAGGAQLLIGPRTGSKTEAFRIPDGLAPGPLRKQIGMTVTRVESLRPGLVAATRGGEGKVERWLEQIESALTPLVETEAGQGVVWQEGAVTYLAGWPDADLALWVVGQGLARAGRSAAVLPEGIRLRRRGDLLFLINYRGAPIAAEALAAATEGYVCVARDGEDGPRQFAIYRRR